MNAKRIIGYGLLYWLTGQIILYLQLKYQPSYQTNMILYYIGGGVITVLFLVFYFGRMIKRPTWKDGTILALSWLVGLTAIDFLIYILWFKISWGSYFSLNYMLGNLEMLALSILIAEVMGRNRKKDMPEGLL